MKKGLIAGLLLALGCVSMASAEDEMTSLSYISYLERYATVQPASQEESLEAVVNMPLVGGDRVDTAREARMEIILADGAWRNVMAARLQHGRVEARALGGYSEKAMRAAMACDPR